MTTMTAAGITTGGMTTGDGRVRRVELGAFLRSRRERITPEEAGLPPGEGWIGA